MFRSNNRKRQKMKQVSTVDQLFDFDFKLLFYSGTYTDQKATCFFFVRKIIVYALSLIQLASMFMQIFTVGDPAEIIQACYISVTHFSFCCKLLNFILRQGELKEIRKFMLQKSFNDHPVEQKQLFGKSMKIFTIIATLYRWMLIFTAIFFATSPLIDEDTILPFNSWYPCDIQKYFWPIYVSQMVAISLSAYNNSTIDLLTVRLLFVTAEQFDILNDNLKNFLGSIRDDAKEVGLKKIVDLRKDVDYADYKIGMDSASDKNFRRHEDLLKIYIRHHYDVLK